MPVKQAKKRECITTYERTEDKMRGTIKGFLIVVFHAKGKVIHPKYYKHVTM